jgi:uncharacterized protein YceK
VLDANAEELCKVLLLLLLLVVVVVALLSACSSLQSREGRAAAGK